MKTFTKLSKALTALSLVSVLAVGSFSNALAASTGQITGAYKIENLTQNTGFANPATANACDSLEYRARLWNPGPGNLNNVMVEVSLSTETSTANTSTISATSTEANPVSTSLQTTVNLSPAQSISYQAGTAQLLDSNTNVVKSLPDSIMNYQGGVNIGSLNASQLEFVQFKAKVNCPTPTPPVTPAFTCNTLGITVGDNRTVKISALGTTQTNGATFNHAVINWGDNTTPVTTDNAVGQTHQYAADGTFTIAATAHFSVNGQDTTAGGPQCQQQVTFSANTPPKVTPPPVTPTPVTPAPTSLVNTGPGSIAGMFAVTTIIGVVGYRWLISRRLSRQ